MRNRMGVPYPGAYVATPVERRPCLICAKPRGKRIEGMNSLLCLACHSVEQLSRVIDLNLKKSEDKTNVK